jgi:hypothetical protein
MRRDTLATPYVARRLQALEQPLTRKPLNVVDANKALKEVVGRVVINPETAKLLLHWHHALGQPTDAGPFASRHFTGFDEPNDDKRTATDACLCDFARRHNQSFDFIYFGDVRSMIRALADGPGWTPQYLLGSTSRPTFSGPDSVPKPAGSPPAALSCRIGMAGAACPCVVRAAATW